MNDFDKYLIIEGAWHLGDDPGMYQNAVYVGTDLSLPMNYRKKQLKSSDCEDVSFTSKQKMLIREFLKN